jgi:hypothetical protein
MEPGAGKAGLCKPAYEKRRDKQDAKEHRDISRGECGSKRVHSVGERVQKPCYRAEDRNRERHQGGGRKEKQHVSRLTKEGI